MEGWGRRRFTTGAGAFLAIGSAGAAEPDEPPIAAASDLKFALDEVLARFKAETGRGLRITYGSAGNFTRQLLQGAPFQMFLSADEGFVFQLADAGKTIDRGTPYATGRIVLFAPPSAPFKPDPVFSTLRSALASGQIRRFAIANPEHAPYGRAAEQALKSQGLWDAIRDKLVFGENVSQAAQFATSLATQGGIFAYSLALAPSIAALGTFALIPSEWHAALRQRMVLMRNAGETARAFHAYVQSPSSRLILRKYGFALPEGMS